MSENSIRGEYFQRLLTLQTQMEGGSIETRVIIDPPNGSTNSEGKPKVILIQTPSYFFLVDAYLVDPWPFSNLCSWMVGWPIPGTWSPWVGLWDDQGWHQWTQSPQVEYSLILPILSGIIWSFLILSNFFWSFLPFFWRYGSKNAPVLHFWCWLFIFLHYDTDFWKKKIIFI